VSDTPCGRSHEPALPQITAAEPSPATPDCNDEDIADLWVGNARFIGVDLDRQELLDLKLDECDVSGVVARDIVMRRIQLHETRLRGVSIANGQLDDGLIDACITDELSMRFTRLRRVVFRGCDLSAADFYNATFDHVTFDRCDLQRARFEAVTANCLAITDCNLAGVSGAFGLRGAQVDAGDLPSLALSLAREAGIRIRDA
jgi:uncharacterized protein YjbI with pentapeptide repeats